MAPYILPGVLTVLILVIFGFAAFYYYGESFILRIFFISLIIMSSLTGLFFCLYYLSLNYTVTNERITYRRGVFNVDTVYIEMYRIKDIEMKEPFFHRIFNLCNIIVFSSDHDFPEFVFHAQKKGFQDSLRSAVEHARTIKGVREIDTV